MAWVSYHLTHFSLVYAYVDWVSIGSGNGLATIQRKAITSANADLLSIRP